MTDRGRAGLSGRGIDVARPVADDGGLADAALDVRRDRRIRIAARALLARVAAAVALPRRHARSDGARAGATGVDPITGLPGRAVIHERAGLVLERLAHDERAAILLLDVDGFGC